MLILLYRRDRQGNGVRNGQEGDERAPHLADRVQAGGRGGRAKGRLPVRVGGAPCHRLLQLRRLAAGERTARIRVRKLCLRSQFSKPAPHTAPLQAVR